jgi:RNA polymerase sigma-70 factor (ECF subfamily)
MAAEVAEVRALVHGPAATHPVDKDVRALRRAAFVEALFKRYYRSLLWFVARIVPNRWEAEEVVQESFVRLLGAEQLETDLRRARNYLFATATNLVRDNHRRKTARAWGLHLAIDDLQLEGDGPEPARVVDIELAGRIVAAALRDLQPRPREAFLLYVHEELTYERIAMRLGVSKKTIERDIAFTLALCRSRLARWSEA